MSSRNGLFVVFEGNDRIGKSTQVKLLAEALSNIYKTETYCFHSPDRTTAIGKAIDNYLRGTEELNPHAVHLLFTANRWEGASDIRRVLSQGRCVVADRYSYSGIVYTAATEHPDVPSWEWCLRSEEDLPQPDIVIWLYPSHIDDLTKRDGFGLERFESTSFQNRVLVNYRRLAVEMEKKREQGEVVPPWIWIEVGKLGISEVHKMVLQAVLDHIAKEPR